MNLYVSDLDGTLLNENAEISEYTKTTLNKLLDSDLNFSIATARTPATVVPILSSLNINLPIVVMNGAAIYDIKSNKYLSYNKIPSDIVEKISFILSKNKTTTFSYTLYNNHINAYYTKSNNSIQENFIKAHNGGPFKTFIDAPLPKDSDVLHFFLMDNKETILNIEKEIKNIEGIYYVAYEDIYNRDLYTLEIYSYKSSKANSIKKIMDDLNFNRLISFGDNLNDIPMFEISDECYAVENASPKLKELSTSVIDSNINDGVIKYIESTL